MSIYIIQEIGVSFSHILSAAAMTPKVKVANPYGRRCISGLTPKDMKPKLEYKNMMPPQIVRLRGIQYRNIAPRIVTNPLRLVKAHEKSGNLITEMRRFNTPLVSDSIIAAESVFVLFICESSLPFS